MLFVFGYLEKAVKGIHLSGVMLNAFGVPPNRISNSHGDPAQTSLPKN